MADNVGKKRAASKRPLKSGGKRVRAGAAALKPRVKTKPAPRPRADAKNGARGVYHPGPLIDAEASLAEAAARLAALDPEVVARLITVGGPPPLRRREPGFAGLAAIIMGQQVSVASAGAIYARLERDLAPLSPQTVLAADEAALRRCGLSGAKIRALRAVAQAMADGALDLGALASLEAHAAHSALTAVHGIGPWTADIFLLFCLGHPDAFPAGDLALQEAAKLALALDDRPNARELEVIAERWRPLRGVAARMLWAYYRSVKQRSGMALADASG
jgi:DNA-3-methyladenine glycosylase II